MRLASQAMPQGPVPPRRRHSRPAKAVQGRHLVVEASGREAPRGHGAVKSTSALVLTGAFSARRRCPAGLVRLDVWTAFEPLALRLSQAVELLLQAIQFVIRAALQRDETGARMLDRAEEFVQLEV